MMTQERARAILDSRLPYGGLRYSFRSMWTGREVFEDGITEEEHKSIFEVWKRMPGHTCYLDAVRAIASGKFEPKKF